jgi:thiol-disulfide isomerase/thioredoxin
MRSPVTRTLMKTLFCAITILPVHDVPVDEGAAEEALAAYRVFRDAGQSAAARANLLQELASLDVKHGEAPDYLLQKSVILSWMGDRPGSMAAFALVHDEDIKPPFHMLNRLGERLRAGELDAAERLVTRLGRVNADLLIDKFHESLAQAYSAEKVINADAVDVKDDRAFLERFNSTTTPTVWGVIQPLALWLDALDARADVDKLVVIAERMRETDGPRIDRYRLLLCQLMMRHESLREASRSLLEFTIAHAGSRASGLGNEEVKQGDRELGHDRARRRYLLASALHHRAKLFGEPEPWLERAADASPDKTDMGFSAGFFYEQALLGCEPEFRSAYARWLESQRRVDDAMEVWSCQARVNPESLPVLREAYIRLRGDEGFEVYWARELQRDLKLAELFELNTPSGEKIRLSDYKGKWLLLDFWGTWCAPCRRELPALQQLVNELRQRGSTTAAILTVACRDEPGAVTRFMSQAEYDYDVVMGTDSVIRSFEVGGFPTKVLITPEGRWFKIEFGADDWQSVARGYLLR